MGVISNIKPSFSGASQAKTTNSEKTIPIWTPKDEASTMATVMLTRFHDKKLQTKFNRLVLMSKNDEAADTFPLNRNITHVGRSRRNHVRINDPLISTKHLTVDVSGNRCMINDLDSSNGTFINGERLDQGRVLKDGDEIMLGKTVLRFAARPPVVHELPGKAHRTPVVKSYQKRLNFLAISLVGVVLAASFAFIGTHITSGRSAKFQPPSAVEAPTSLRITTEESAAASAVEAPVAKTSHIQRALTEYADGQIDSARQTLKMVLTAKEWVPEGLAAKRIMSKISTIQEVYGQALKAQEQRHFARAIEYWDRLLVLDMELIGDRPSFIAMAAEQSVQILSFEYALEALGMKNHEKARQLCQAILKINPGNQDALALISRIDPRA